MTLLPFNQSQSCPKCRDPRPLDPTYHHRIFSNVEYLEYICKCGFYFKTETADVHPVNVYDGNGKFADVVREYCDGVKRYAQTRPGSSETTGEKVCECKSVDVVSERKCPCLEGSPHVCKDGEALLSEPSCHCECHKKSHPIDIVEELTNQ